ncbi:hypothetical protein [Pseudomonas sp.]|uniref:hypothetical protein n=1 Tax=Pseudomonas sp. TaxID=306 RepID=UPI003CC69FBD
MTLTQTQKNLTPVMAFQALSGTVQPALKRPVMAVMAVTVVMAAVLATVVAVLGMALAVMAVMAVALLMVLATGQGMGLVMALAVEMGEGTGTAATLQQIPLARLLRSLVRLATQMSSVLAMRSCARFFDRKRPKSVLMKSLEI